MKGLTNWHKTTDLRLQTSFIAHGVSLKTFFQLALKLIYNEWWQNSNCATSEQRPLKWEYRRPVVCGILNGVLKGLALLTITPQQRQHHHRRHELQRYHGLRPPLLELFGERLTRIEEQRVMKARLADR
jgi:hypothetical protein